MEFRPYRNWQIFDGRGGRKYLNAAERERLLSAADCARPDIRALCYVLTLTGCRISEALALTPNSVDHSRCTLTYRTLKRRQTCFRTVPVPQTLCQMLAELPPSGSAPFWPIHRTTAWRHLKILFAETGVAGSMACCRGFRHGFGIHAALNRIPLSLIQRWMGHADPTTTVIYLDAVDAEERRFAERMW